MNILVCIKQVPDTTEIKIDPVKNTLIRDGVPSIVNPFDTYALESAARIKDNNPDAKIVVVTMGPPQAEKALRECLAIAADKAYLVTDRAFGGSDTLATSYVLRKTVEKLEALEGKFDAIFCGKQAIDGDTGQVGPELAEWLDLPQVTNCWEVEVAGDSFKAKKQTDDGFEIIGVKMPCLITYTQPAWEVRYPNIKRKLAANKAEVPQITVADLADVEEVRLGLNGSPTKVKKSFVPPKREGGIKIEEETPEEGAKKLFKMLNDASII
ncbi:MAG: electron transfer flavoprotein subunit beta/FixA family protein [Spirochaetaceae bacterium]|nr:electron transfer flavoprotein subunit beta/FixA family protein [Spirochaetaceae bacterium]